MQKKRQGDVGEGAWAGTQEAGRSGGLVGADLQAESELLP